MVGIAMRDKWGEAARQAAPSQMDWRVGQRVHREDDTQHLGTVTEVNRSDIKVQWDSGGISFYQLKEGHIPLRTVEGPPGTAP
jgi:hypothetical protein